MQKRTPKNLTLSENERIFNPQMPKLSYKDRLLNWATEYQSMLELNISEFPEGECNYEQGRIDMCQNLIDKLKLMKA